MRDFEDDDRDLMVIDETAMPGAVTRWLPAAVVLCVVAGFVALAWYAYHAGTQSVKDEDLLVVEADKTPIKEKPLDPGGMKFPNQDKTVFETFAGKQEPAKVERVVPAPEEPLPANMDMSGTTTWVNDKLNKGTQEKPAQAALEQVVGDDKNKKQETATPVEAKAEPAPAAAAPAKPEPAPLPAADAAAKPEPAPKPESKPVAKVVEAAPAAAPEGAFKVQLGAYRSEKEAKAAWNKIALAHRDIFKGMKPTVMKADLGSRGIYYRLRVLGFASASDAGAFCSKLTAIGQACILSTDK